MDSCFSAFEIFALNTRPQSSAAACAVAKKRRALPGSKK